MLFVLTAADLAAVGPGVWDQWKSLLLTDLLDRTMEHLAGESPATSAEAQTARRSEVRKLLGPDSGLDWFARQIETLPSGYLSTTEPEQIAADLRMLHGLKTGDVVAEGRYLPETETTQFVIGTSEATTPGAFHKLTGALTSQGLQIRSAQINTLADALVLDRFWVHDPDYPLGPPPDRIDRIQLALVQSLQASDDRPPTFRRTWQESRQAAAPSPNVATRVNADNTTSQQYTILDIFASDRSGLLYAVTRSLFELGLSVWRAKVGTYGDQVVDVFYVTDQHGQKIHDEPRLEEIRRRVLEVIRSG
jgi:[protein-PII] uridylyltransferase